MTDPNTQGSLEPMELKACPECRCSSFAKVDEPTLDGKWDNTKIIRCVNCKATYAASSPPSEGMREALEAIRTAVTYTAPPVDFGTPDDPNPCYEARIPVAFIEQIDAALSSSRDHAHTSSALGWRATGGVYVASRASILARGEMWREHRRQGAPITSTWIDEDGPKASRDLSGLWVRIAAEIAAARLLVLYVEPDDFPLKGAFIEIGMALALSVPIVIVAPGVTLDERNCRPLGSWIKHPLVSFADTVAEALTTPPQDEQQTPTPDLVDVLRDIRVFVQDCIETGHDRGSLGNLYSARDLIDRALNGASHGK